MITRHRLLFFVGIWIVLIPFLGFPTDAKTFLVIVSGLFVALIAFSSARAKRLSARRPRRERVSEKQVEIVTTAPAEDATVTTVTTEEHITDVDSSTS